MLNIAIEAAKEAGKFLKHNLGKVKEINLKGRMNIVYFLSGV